MIASVVVITRRYFEAMATPLARGRYFPVRDRQDTLCVAIVDESLAARLGPGEDPFGKRIYRGRRPVHDRCVVRDVRLERLTGSIDALPISRTRNAPPLRRLRWIAIMSFAQSAFVVGALRSALLEVDRNLPIADVQTVTERTARSLSYRSVWRRLWRRCFALVALFCRCWASTAYSSTLSFPARAKSVFESPWGAACGVSSSSCWAEGAVLIAAGLALGLAGALALARMLEGMILASSRQSLCFSFRWRLQLAGVLLACVAPASGATRVNPVEALSDP